MEFRVQYIPITLTVVERISAKVLRVQKNYLKLVYVPSKYTFDDSNIHFFLLCNRVSKVRRHTYLTLNDAWLRTSKEDLVFFKFY